MKRETHYAKPFPIVLGLEELLPDQQRTGSSNDVDRTELAGRPLKQQACPSCLVPHKRHHPSPGLQRMCEMADTTGLCGGHFILEQTH